MDIKMNKEIRSYREKVGGNLTMRQCIAVILMLIAIFSEFLRFHETLDRNLMSWIYMITATPFILFGDFMPPYNGMKSEKLLLVFLRYAFIEPRQLKFVGKNAFMDEMKADERSKRNAKSLTDENTDQGNQKRKVHRSKHCAKSNSDSSDI